MMKFLEEMALEDDKRLDHDHRDKGMITLIK